MAAVLGDFIEDVCFSCLWYHSAQFQVATSSCEILRHRNDAFGRILLAIDTPASKSFWACYLGWNSHSYYLVSNSQLLSSPRSTKQVLYLKLHIETNPVCSSKQPEECKCLCVAHTHLTVQPSYTIKITILIFAKAVIFGTLCWFVFLLLLLNGHRHQKKYFFQEFEMKVWYSHSLLVQTTVIALIYLDNASLLLLQRILTFGSLCASRALSVY